MRYLTTRKGRYVWQKIIETIFTLTKKARLYLLQFVDSETINIMDYSCYLVEGYNIYFAHGENDTIESMPRQ